MTPISFFAEGLPKGQPRPRAFAFHGKARVYDPGTAEGWKSAIAAAARPYVRHAIKEPVAISCLFVLPRPQSHYGSGKKAGVLRADAPLYCAKKPDLDNYEKAVWDTLVVIGLLHDDALIVQSHSAKLYSFGMRSGCRVEIRPADNLFAVSCADVLTETATSLPVAAQDVGTLAHETAPGISMTGCAVAG